MTEISLKVKALDALTATAILKNMVGIIQSSNWDGSFEHSIDSVQSDGEASLLIVNNEEEYHGVKINCCE